MQVLTRLIFPFPFPFPSHSRHSDAKSLWCRKTGPWFPCTTGNFIQTHLLGPPDGTTPFSERGPGLTHLAKNLGQVRRTQLEKTRGTPRTAHWPMDPPSPWPPSPHRRLHSTQMNAAKGGKRVGWTEGASPFWFRPGGMLGNSPSLPNWAVYKEKLKKKLKGVRWSQPESTF